jgi:hypothetical protein
MCRLDQYGRVGMAERVHGDGDSLLNRCLFKRRLKAIAFDSSPATQFAELVAEHQVKTALRTFLFPCPVASTQ